MMNPNTDLDLRDVTVLGNRLLDKLDVVRETEGIAWNESVGAWLVTRHQDVMDGFRGKYPLMNAAPPKQTSEDMTIEQKLARWPKMLATFPHWLINIEPPTHTRVRSLMTKAFSGRYVESLRPFVRGTIANALESVSERSTVDVVEEVAREITGRVILHIFGLPDHVRGKLKEWAYHFNAGFGNGRPTPEAMDKVEQCLCEMEALFEVEIEKRRLVPNDDFLSMMVAAQEGKHKLSDEELFGLCYLTIIAGHDSTLNSMALGVAALIENHEGREYMLANPDRILNSVMEISRFIAMATEFHRFAAEDFEWDGKQIRKGDEIYLMVAAANRDPRVFDNPEVLDLSRPTEQVAVFGAGIHQCIGHLLAKMQLSEFYPAFFLSFPDAQLVDGELDFQPSLSFRGLNKLQVKLCSPLSSPSDAERRS